MENSLVEPLIGKSLTETKPLNKNRVEKRLKKYEDLIETEIDKVKIQKNITYYRVILIMLLLLQ